MNEDPAADWTPTCRFAHRCYASNELGCLRFNRAPEIVSHWVIRDFIGAGRWSSRSLPTGIPMSGVGGILDNAPL